ncbi:hypothetical protein CERSUDRAFT_118254 [Gelatoporia subvermispora B]|uniref:Uncharacterized protein n=1 Tax=Ceriporiopsis subvermispora (strain B) TaxID=914234 RepID=M2R2R7_CERS8|nr:hypothetical protein CERSUDRAFT_118254 [Gelatoporia subvermispora B]
MYRARPTASTGTVPMASKHYEVSMPPIPHRELYPEEISYIFLNPTLGKDNVLVRSLEDCHKLFVRPVGALCGRIEYEPRLPWFNSLKLELDPDALSHLVQSTLPRVHKGSVVDTWGPRVVASGLVLSQIRFFQLSAHDVARFGRWARHTIVAPSNGDPRPMQLSLKRCQFRNIIDVLALLREPLFGFLAVENVQLVETPKAVHQHVNTVKIPALSMSLWSSQDIALLSCLTNAADRSMSYLDLQVCNYIEHHDMGTLQRFITDRRLVSLTLALRSQVGQRVKPTSGYQIITQTLTLLQRASEIQRHRLVAINVYLPRTKLFRELMPMLGAVSSRSAYILQALNMTGAQYSLYDGPDEWYLAGHSNARRRI